MLIASFATTLIGILVFLFLFWKRLRDDYAPEIIFKTSFTVLAGILIGFLISLKFLPNTFLWLGFVGAIAGLAVSVFRIKVKFYETFEAVIIAALPWVSFIFLFDSVTNSSLLSFLAFIAVLILIFISYFLDSHYKGFTWYKSGRIGFAGIATTGLIFLIRTAIAIFNINMLTFLNQKFEIAVSGTLAIACFLLVLKLANDKK